ncbi:PH domain-containing protein [Simiduia aestuariiviva]|uniref:Putative membrane protein YdbT with pleckstrin-like domain n=1 Tax=Simiduia aestuariiviva TaxID=1510459 RepID=A0A839UTE0_9GAMM|nr:PH domain-containing protein [Simiduia aestuariiviva]MBB3169720.1 putative membrane protein YdbT with pleckstrin-like domain [Simiduia aestuariiviva]
MTDAVAPGTKFSAHPAMFKARPFSFILCVLLCAVGIGILILMVWYVKCKSTKLSIIDNEVVLERGLLSKERIELGLASIRSVRVYQSFLNRITGVGKITVFTAGDSPEFEVDGIPEPNKFRELT